MLRSIELNIESAIQSIESCRSLARTPGAANQLNVAIGMAALDCRHIRDIAEMAINTWQSEVVEFLQSQ